MRTHPAYFFFAFFKKVLSLSFFFSTLFPKKKIKSLPPHTPFLKRRARCALLLLLLERDRETQKARGSIVDTSYTTAARFLLCARSGFFFRTLSLYRLGRANWKKAPARAHKLRRRFREFSIESREIDSRRDFFVVKRARER